MAYLLMPAVGSAYKFLFTSKFNHFDDVYEVVKIMSYEEYIGDGRQLLSDFYEPCELTEDDLTADLEEVRSSKILKLHKPDTESSADVYAPLCFVSQVPDCNVKKYYNIGMISKIGITENPDDLDNAKNTFIEIIEASTGITPDPIFTTIGEGKWMTETEYQEEVAKRDATKKKILNFYTSTKKLELELAEARTKIKAYEALIVELHEQNEELREKLGE